jgi:hypothetical protein
MNLQYPQHLVCSGCNTLDDYEYFQKMHAGAFYSGVRCLRCGHECSDTLCSRAAEQKVNLNPTTDASAGIPGITNRF